MAANVVGISGQVGFQRGGATMSHYIVIPKEQGEKTDLAITIGSAIATDVLTLLEGDALTLRLDIYLTDTDDCTANLCGIERLYNGKKAYPFVWNEIPARTKGGE